MPGLPTEQSPRLGHVGDAPVAILVSGAVKLLGGDIDDFGIGIAGLSELFVEDRFQELGKPANRGLVFGR